MVIEFSRKLREDLGKLLESHELRGRADTSESETVRMSMDSVRSLQREGPAIAEEYSGAFAD
jgi:hypothetical protein